MMHTMHAWKMSACNRLSMEKNKVFQMNLIKTIHVGMRYIDMKYDGWKFMFMRRLNIQVWFELNVDQTTVEFSGWKEMDEEVNVHEFRYSQSMRDNVQIILKIGRKEDGYKFTLYFESFIECKGHRKLEDVCGLSKCIPLQTITHIPQLGIININQQDRPCDKPSSLSGESVWSFLTLDNTTLRARVLLRRYWQIRQGVEWCSHTNG